MMARLRSPRDYPVKVPRIRHRTWQRFGEEAAKLSYTVQSALELVIEGIDPDKDEMQASSAPPPERESFTPQVRVSPANREKLQRIAQAWGINRGDAIRAVLHTTSRNYRGAIMRGLQKRLKEKG